MDEVLKTAPPKEDTDPQPVPSFGVDIVSNAHMNPTGTDVDSGALPHAYLPDGLAVSVDAIIPAHGAVKFTAKQSEWKGQRGKPRCDHCRANNLKCDRVLPACNHCCWVGGTPGTAGPSAGRECKYTPLPTPAHRGVPRCDPCRQKNRKCDRGVPQCNQCSKEGTLDTCLYTHKKRSIKGGKGIVPEGSTPPATGDDTEEGEGELSVNGDMDSPYENNPIFTSEPLDSALSRASSSKTGKAPKPSKAAKAVSARSHPYRTTRSSSRIGDMEARGTPDSRSQTPDLAPAMTRVPLSTTSKRNNGTFIAHSFSQDKKSGAAALGLVEPWRNPKFAPLPASVLDGLALIKSADMPARYLFDDKMADFLIELIPELQQTATLPADAYLKFLKVIEAKENSVLLSERQMMWLQCHRIMSGSDTMGLLVMPQDAYFHLNAGASDALRKDYAARIDGCPNQGDIARLIAANPPPPPTGQDNTAIYYLPPPPPKWRDGFVRIPVQPQIYDLLAYAHRTHQSSADMLMEIRDLGIGLITFPMADIFVRICPACNPPKTRAVKGEPSVLKPLMTTTVASTL